MIIGISAPWLPADVAGLAQFTGNNLGEIDGVRFEIVNGSSDRYLDAWVVIDDIPTRKITTRLPSQKLIYMSGESIHAPDYFLSKQKQQFLSQFSRIFSCYVTGREDSEYSPPVLPWMLNSNHGTIFRHHQRDLHYLSGLQPFEKTREISIICSNKTITPEQRLRLDFANKMKKYFGSSVDWFGDGFDPIAEKWDGLAPYRVTVALENRQTPGMFTEKILDPFLSWTTPVYWGAPDIHSFLPVSLQQQLDFKDFPESMRRIRNQLDSVESPESIGRLRRGRDLVLNEHNFLKRIIKAAKKTPSYQSNDRREFCTVESQFSFGLKARLNRLAGR